MANDGTSWSFVQHRIHIQTIATSFLSWFGHHASIPQRENEEGTLLFKWETRIALGMNSIHHVFHVPKRFTNLANTWWIPIWRICNSNLLNFIKILTRTFGVVQTSTKTSHTFYCKISTKQPSNPDTVSLSINHWLVKLNEYWNIIYYYLCTMVEGWFDKSAPFFIQSVYYTKIMSIKLFINIDNWR